MTGKPSLCIATVIPSRNDGDFLEQCLRALADQSRPSDIVVVVDNDSTDNTAEIAALFGAHVVREETRGVGAASACGYDEAAKLGADIIARVDADSVPPSDWIQRIEDAFGPRPTLDAVTGRAEFYGTSPFKRWAGAHLYINLMAPVLSPLLGHPPVFGSNFAMRTAVWEQLSHTVNRSNPDVHDDMDLSIQMPRSARVVNDKTLIMPVSGRPFDTWGSLGTRLRKVVVTLQATYPRWAWWVQGEGTPDLLDSQNNGTN